jgi:hypothetical protein
MITKVQLFLSMKDESVARPLGVRRLRQAPESGQKFQIAVDGRPVRARITRFSSETGPVPGETGPVPGVVPQVYAEEI